MEGKIAHWSAENATKAYLKTLKMGIKRAKEPDVSEFISAIAAGNNAQLMVVICEEALGPTTLQALLAAAHQTGGRVICIFRGLKELNSSKQSLSLGSEEFVEFVMGDSKRLILEEYKEADFVLINCKLENHEVILQEMQSSGKFNKAFILGYNAFSSRSWQWAGLRAQLLPIGEGLLVARMKGANEERERERRRRRSCESSGCSVGRKSHWVVKVDRHTGEEHVFRVRCLRGKEIDGQV